MIGTRVWEGELLSQGRQLASTLCAGRKRSDTWARTRRYLWALPHTRMAVAGGCLLAGLLADHKTCVERAAGRCPAVWLCIPHFAPSPCLLGLPA